jgi:hypothetical protein
MKKRSKIPFKKSKRDFKRGAKSIHKKNAMRPMRGGFRL